MNIILFEPSETGRPLAPRDERAIHLLKVLRKKPGDFFNAGVLDGLRGQGRIETLNPDGSLEFSLDLREEPPPRSSLRMGLGFSRPIQLRRILRDLSTLGLEAVDLTGTELGEKSYRDTNLISGGGARSAMIEGAVQARDTRLPLLSVYPSLGDWLRAKPWAGNQGEPLLIAADHLFPSGSFADLGSPGSLRGRRIVLAVGSERGWSEAERELLEETGFARLSLGSRILRTETASTAAAVLTLEKIGFLG